MKLKYAYLSFITILLFSIISCRKELEKVNQNPNAAQKAQPDYLLTAAIKTTADSYWGTSNNMNSSLLFVQYWSKIQYTDPDRYIFSNNDFRDLWTTAYSKSIVNLNGIISLADEQKNDNYKGVALVFRSWVYQLLTDAYGDIPYRQSAQIDEYLTPAYDTQQEVYEGLLNDLKTAQSALDPHGKAISGDIIYNNDIALWKKFANSLRLRIALRIADREPELSQKVLNEIQSEGGFFISDNSENAQLVYLNSPNQNPINNLFDTRDDYRISKTIVDKLFVLSDPRLPVYAAKTQAATAPTYVGIPNGLLVGDASNLGFSKTSKPGAYFTGAHAPAVILSYSEVLFDRAEAAARGFTNEDAEQLYVKAIKASLQQYDVPEDEIDSYIAQPAVKYDPANFRKSIGEQKWIALFGQGLEAFAEWRRLDYPKLEPAVAGVLDGKLPLRFIYPGTEQSLNGENYKAAVAHQGPDQLTTRLWFDVN